MFYFSQQVFTIIKRDNENIIISINETFDSNGKIKSVSLNAYSTLQTSLNPIATLDGIFVYDKKYNFLDHIFIQDIISKEFNNGYGSMLMKTFLQYLTQFKISKVTGHLSWVDLGRPNDHKNLLYHFYKKFGFKIMEDNFIELKIE